jgi:uncharacterized protein YqeY
MIYDFAISGHSFRIKGEEGIYKLYSIYADIKKKGKKTTVSERESVEIFSKNIEQLRNYVSKYFYNKRDKEVAEVFDGIKH